MAKAEVKEVCGATMSSQDTVGHLHLCTYAPNHTFPDGAHYCGGCKRYFWTGFVE